jgi:tripartite-type tricarboxylate transporter receptor subunit TctC
MKLSLRTTLRGLAAAASLAFGLHAPAFADTWPSKPVKLIVTFVPGGGADIIGRYVAKHLGDALGQPVIVENKPGAGGLIGVQAGLAAPADGYTFVLISSSYTVNPSLYKLKFDPVNDITPVVQVSKGPLLVVANPKVPATNVKELVALGKAKQGALNYASSGQGSLLHLAAAQFADEAGFDMRHVPYKGGGAALTDLVAGQVDLYFAATASAMPFVKSGKLRALAVTTEERIPALPDVPTIAESGFKGYEATLWYGIIAPKGLPPEILRRMNAEVNKVLAMKETPAKLEVDGALPGGGTPAAFQAVIAREIPKWGKVVRKIGIQPE